MKKVQIATLFCFFLLCNLSFGQDAFSAFTDFHIHPTYKHYNRPRTAAVMRMLLLGTDTTEGRIRFTPELVDYFKNASQRDKASSADNWESFLLSRRNNNKPLKRGEISHLRNYDQASYAELKYTPGSILCNSFYPFEKQYALGWGKRLLNSLLVTRMGMRRLKYYSRDVHTPFKDFLAEYYFSQIQDSIQKIHIIMPETLYESSKQSGRGNEKQIFFNHIKLVKDSKDLRRVLAHNLSIDNNNSNDTIITPILMTIEGAQVLYGPISGREGHIGKPKKDKMCGEEDAIEKELKTNVLALKNLPHRLFFITLGHFAQNHVVGFAKTIDRDSEHYQHRLPALFSNSAKIRNNLVHKSYNGFNNQNGKELGFEIVKAFLDPATSKYGKPTYIDVKHMDVKARIEYYHLRRRLEKEMNISIPIVASHSAVSGEKQAMAAATGLWPNFDLYQESENPKEFYNKKILRNENPENRKKHWVGVMNGKAIKGDRSLDCFERSMYKPNNFKEPLFSDCDEYDPFIDYNLDADSTVGWFYPWSLNLFDEEIIEINKSNGIIGLLLDPRQLGAFAPNYNKAYQDYIANFFNIEIDKIDSRQLAELKLKMSDLDFIEYMKVEPLLRNVFYIVRLASYQSKAEKLQEPNRESLNNYFYRFIPDDVKMQKDPWDFIALGSDYDDQIDPIDLAPTASYIPLLHRRLVVYAFIFAQIHANNFHEPHLNNQPLISSLKDSEYKMKKLFYENGKNFILEYF